MRVSSGAEKANPLRCLIARPELPEALQQLKLRQWCRNIQMIAQP